MVSGYKIHQASNGLEALKILESEEVDCILLDMKIPRMNGLEILKQIRDNKLSIPVFMMTAFREQELIDEAGKLGVVNYFTKPFNIFDIRNEVVKVLEQGQDYSVEDR
ncbi:response regulator [Lysinibacillus telephonicus]|uniref:Response regulator n=1 Tax=Lysinibacillus telephonicus TaxID=1714840 RepID=A0A3S0JIQ1_9BACI|nr:response regulator [Lysinibacillus telephonicus]RTQ86223.1 response regulator [Lysinibacillus telephonicus]